VDTAPFWLPTVDLESMLLNAENDWEWFRNRRLFITGGTGFVGKWLVGALLFANERFGLRCHITLLSRDPKSFLTRFPELGEVDAIDLLKGHVRDFVFPKEKYDTVIHAAADVANPTLPRSTFEDLLDGTRRTLQLAVHCAATDFLLVSSGAALGRQPSGSEGFKESDASDVPTTNTKSAYGEGKRSSELLCCLYAEEYGFNYKIARCFAFVGPHLSLNSQFAIGNFVRDALLNTEIEIKGDGTPLRTYLYTSDMATWLLRILVKGDSGEIYNVGGEEAISIRELAELTIKTLSSKSRAVVRTASVPDKSPDRYVPNTAKARTNLGLVPTVPLATGIQKYAAWCERHTML
jgi:nucleoside-diphosphate-sugar epimerase